jgi:RNA polymerase sigma factor (sigma-70 family)
MKFSDISNEELYQMCLQGNEGAWRYVFNYVLAVARSPKWRLRDTPEDLAQGIVCRLLERIDRVREPKAFRGFIRQVAVHFVLDHVRGLRPGLESLDARDPGDDRREVPEPVSENPGPEDLVLGSSLLQTLQRAVERLAPRCRKAVSAYMDYKAGVYASYKALAKALGKSIGTLSAQIKRCLDELRRVDGIRQWLEA